VMRKERLVEHVMVLSAPAKDQTHPTKSPPRTAPSEIAIASDGEAGTRLPSRSAVSARARGPSPAERVQDDMRDPSAASSASSPSPLHRPLPFIAAPLHLRSPRSHPTPTWHSAAYASAPVRPRRRNEQQAQPNEALAGPPLPVPRPYPKTSSTATPQKPRPRGPEGGPPPRGVSP
jgi:hypothetical protein